MDRTNRHLKEKLGYWHYQRRVPKRYASFDPRGVIECSLRTKSLEIARMRRDGYNARKLSLYLDMRGGGWVGEQTLPSVHDDHACLDALKSLWHRANIRISKRASIFRVGVTLLDIVSAEHRQLDLLMDDDRECQRWEAITDTIDGLNSRFGKRVVTMGAWKQPPGGFTGGKIAFTRIPSAQDFW